MTRVYHNDFHPFSASGLTADLVGTAALPCDGLCYKTVRKWTILVRYYSFLRIQER